MNEDLHMIFQIIKYKIYEKIDFIMDDIVLCRDMEDYIDEANLTEQNLLNVYELINNINRSHDYPQEYTKCKNTIHKCLFENKWDINYNIVRYLNFILEEYGEDIDIGNEEDYI